MKKVLLLLLFAPLMGRAQESVEQYYQRYWHSPDMQRKYEAEWPKLPPVPAPTPKAAPTPIPPYPNIFLPYRPFRLDLGERDLNPLYIKPDLAPKPSPTPKPTPTP